MTRDLRRVLPAAEGLESKLLLSTNLPNGRPASLMDLDRQALIREDHTIPLQDRQLSYTTLQGTHVTVTLHGLGTLHGSSVDPATGALNLIYNNTDASSRIVGIVSGGTNRAPLAGLRDADVSPRSPVSTGSEPLDTVNLRNFDLIPGGYINLTGGVKALYLASAGRDTQIHLHEAAPVPSSSAASPTSTGAATASPTPQPTGVDVQIPQVNAAALGRPPLGPPQIFGYDPKANALISFDGTTGNALRVIPLAGMTGTPIAGVGLGRDAGRLVVLVGSDQTIHAFSVETGDPLGQFTTANLTAEGFHRVDGIGSTDVLTVLTDASAGPNGLAQAIDVTASLASGRSVPVGLPFSPQREFELSGGTTGLAGSNLIYATGAAHFDTFQPDLTQLGILSFTTTGPVTVETSRTAVPGIGTPFQNVGPPGTVGRNPNQALGSIDGDLALDTGVVNGRNVVTLYNPKTLAPDGVIGLASPNRLAGLSESFHPELLDAALIDVQGNLKRFVGTRATGLIINDTGSLNLVAIGQATDTAIIGRPLNHVAIPIRRNVQLLSTTRGPIGQVNRGGITVIPQLRPAGPLTLP